MPVGYRGNDAVWVDSVPIPVDGDASSEAVLAPAWKKNTDRSAYLKRVLPSAHSWASALVLPTAALWTYGNTATIETTIAIGGKLDVPGCKVGDKIQVNAFFMFRRTSIGLMTKPFDIWIDAIDNALVAPGVQTHVPGANLSADDGLNSGLQGCAIPIALSGTWTVAASGTTRLTVAFEGPTFISGDTTQIWHGFNINAVLFPAP